MSALPADVELARRRVVNATMRFRYGAAVTGRDFGTMPKADEVAFLNAAADWLDAFAVVLADGCDKANAARAEYDRLRHDVDAFRRVIGTAS